MTPAAVSRHTCLGGHVRAAILKWNRVQPVVLRLVEFMSTNYPEETMYIYIYNFGHSLTISMCIKQGTRTGNIIGRASTRSMLGGDWATSD